MKDDSSTITPTVRTAVRRHRERGEYDRDAVYAILDEAFICHVACSVDGTVWMIPTAYGRQEDRLFLHGAQGNNVLAAAARGAELTATVTLVDGLVLARSTFSHSINYRSVVVFGRAREITRPRDKADALATVVNHMLPGRTSDAREPSGSELKQTRVVELRLDEASAKVRTGGPLDKAEDERLAVWAGVLPLKTAAGAPLAEATMPTGLPQPAYLAQVPRWGRLM